MPAPPPSPRNVVPKDNLLTPFLLGIQQGKVVGIASFTYITLSVPTLLISIVGIELILRIKLRP